MMMTLICAHSFVNENLGKVIQTREIYVRKSRPLPSIGDPVTAINEETKEEYPGEVIEVHEKRHAYVARVQLIRKDGRE